MYLLPRGHSTFRTIYDEGYRSCSGTEINNPYSLCSNLPNICDKSTRHAGQSLLPTILATWSLKADFYQGSQKIEWNAPSPETNLLLTAKVILRMPLRSRKRQHIPNLQPRSDVVMSQDGCCYGNRYRSSTSSSNCEICPERSTSNLGGLYCEIDESSAIANRTDNGIVRCST